MRIILVILSFLTILNLKSNFRSDKNLTTIISSIPQTPDLDSIWNVAQEEIKLDSSTIIINCSFWYTRMPGADNAQTCWNLEPTYKINYEERHFDYVTTNAYFISNMEDKNKGFETFTYNEKQGWYKDHKFYFNPKGVILVLYNQKKNEWVYLKKSGPFQMGRVE